MSDEIEAAQAHEGASTADAAPRPQLVELELRADPEAWRAAGFAVGVDGRCRIGTTELMLSGGDGGFAGWTIAGAIPSEDGLDGVATRVAPVATTAEPVQAPVGAPAPTASQPSDAALAPDMPVAHPNGVTAIDHVVLTTPDTARTFETLEAAGFALRRVRDAGTPERPLRQGFFLFADALLEVVGPPEAAPGAGGPAALWGITLVTDDLAAAAARFGATLSAPRPAVQPGREIAIVTREAGLGVRVALMTPRS